MSLNWNMQNLADQTPAADGGKGFWWNESDAVWSTTETMIFATMAVDLGEITEKNVTEFYARLHTIELLQGSFRRQCLDGGEWTDRPFTLDEVRRYIGMTTNVISLTRKQWLTNHLTNYVTTFAREA